MFAQIDAKRSSLTHFTRVGLFAVLLGSSALMVGCERKEKIVDIETPRRDIEVERDPETGETDVEVNRE